MTVFIPPSNDFTNFELTDYTAPDNDSVDFGLDFDIQEPISGQVARYKLDGNINDTWGSSDGTNNGTSFVDGVFGQAASFNSSETDFISFPASTFEISSSCTISIWYKTTDSGDKQPLVALFGDDRLRIAINDSSSGFTTDTIDVQTENGRITFNTTLADGGVWNNIAITNDIGSDELILYLNGSRVSSTSGVSQLSSFTEAYLGRITTTASSPKWFDGVAEEFRFYSEVLSPVQVEELYHRGFYRIKRRFLQ